MMRTLLILLLIPSLAFSAVDESICYGTTNNGKLVGGVKLPDSGNNFQSYSSIGNLIGRTYIHSKVKNVILNSYQKLKSNAPGKVFMYGETGWKNGDRFKPHKTHQNGLSVDFMVPVLKAGKSVYLPTSPLNKFGYGIEFDEQGKFAEYYIDFEAMAAHLVELHKEARAQNIAIWRVIFAPELQPWLFQTKYGEYLKQNLEFSKKRSWVRHDEHYHVDFAVDCQKM